MSGDPKAAAAPDRRRTLIDNKQAKTSATYVNGLAIAVFAVGGLAPLVASISGSSQAPGEHGVVLGVAAFCWIGSGALYLLSRRILEGLKKRRCFKH